jgi:hypothetical protein
MSNVCIGYSSLCAVVFDYAMSYTPLQWSNVGGVRLIPGFFLLAGYINPCTLFASPLDNAKKPWMSQIRLLTN